MSTTPRINPKSKAKAKANQIANTNTRGKNLTKISSEQMESTNSFESSIKGYMGTSDNDNVYNNRNNDPYRSYNTIVDDSIDPQTAGTESPIPLPTERSHSSTSNLRYGGRLSNRNSLSNLNMPLKQIPSSSTIPLMINPTPQFTATPTNNNITNSTQIPDDSIDVRKSKYFWNTGSLLLENKGSVARDHLASERTFLAWLRTSLSLASVGVGVTQLLKLSKEDPKNESEFQLNNTSTGIASNGINNNLERLNKSIGLLFIILAIICILIGAFRYFLVQEMLLKKEFPASKLGVGFLICSVFSLSVLILSVVFFI
ncbi:hypothetical protein B5S28_g2254 [[Candida] boidinii]|nr:hypothetical protein B5S28_g2254 [[Candida] boidinii]OWB62886.1 hypothetical protein B5S29_g3835 [[Candida] boidinii]OWB75420.1 hypothetical protein B5S31_g5316 [[Candida] boidinii]OWB76898.1 hypothetical protein B5S32_g1055 [[Candida] boidinii]